MLLRSCFSVTMMSHFQIVDKAHVEELKDKSKNENMKYNTEYWKNIFKQWVNERNFQANLEEYKGNVLDQTLSHFYVFKSSVILSSMLLTSCYNGYS